jgi:hypothetical protein
MPIIIHMFLNIPKPGRTAYQESKEGSLNLEQDGDSAPIPHIDDCEATSGTF